MSQPSSARPPGRVAVIGGGRMGAGIAQVFAAAGAQVTVVERDAAAVGAARQRILEGLAKAAERGRLTAPADEVAGRVGIIREVEALPGDCDLVVEAVPERMDLKLSVLAAAEAAVGADAILATNTSALPITELAAALAHPRRFLGLHFFNPVPASALVEVVVGPETSQDAVEVALGWVRSIDKADVVVRDSPGFASSRLGVALGLEAIRMLEEGVSGAEAIDRAMELGYRHPMGPLRLTDLVGLDVRLAIAEHLAATLGPRFEPPRLLREKVERGELGRKTGRGFHDW